jgi:hypothetical protein
MRAEDYTEIISIANKVGEAIGNRCEIAASGKK